MNRKGFTLVEIVISIALLGIIAVSIMPVLTYAYANLFKSKKYTDDTFLAQQEFELNLEAARNADAVAGEPDVDTVSVFGKSVNAHSVQLDIEPPDGSAHGKMVALVPKHEFVYNVPEVKSVSLAAYRNGTVINAPSFLYPVDTTLSFRGSDGGLEAAHADEFLLNVYRWYMSPILTVDNHSVTPNVKDWIIIKEWNEARSPLSYAASDNLDFIPNIEANFNELKLSEFTFLNPADPQAEIADRFAGRYFVYSVTPYSRVGRVGEEKFSAPISTNRIDSVDGPIRKTHEWVAPTTYSLSGQKAQALMIDGTSLEVNVAWDQTSIAVTGPGQGEVTVTGSVAGFSEPVEFILEIVDNIDNSPGNADITGPTSVVGPTSGSSTYNYSAVIRTASGVVLPDAVVAWSLASPKTGVSIATTGDSTARLTVTSAATSGTVTIRAAAAINPAIYNELSVTVVKPGQVAAVNSSASAQNLSSPYRARFTAIVKDVNGYFIPSLGFNDFTLRNIYDSSDRTLTQINNRSGYSVTEFTENPAANSYSWVIQYNKSIWESSFIRDNVRVRARNPAISTSYVIIEEDIDGVRIS